MIKMWVLVLVINSGNSSQEEGLTVINQEFNSLETCQMAMNSIIEQTNKTYSIRVKSSGCYLK